jgi:replicative DNA helicase
MSKTKINDYINKQAVREVLGSFIKDPTLMKEYKTTQSDFVENFHKLIFSAIHNLYRNGVKEIDALAIDEYLSHYETQYEIFKKNQGVEFIEKIVDLSLVTNIKYYHDLLKKFTLLRRYVEIGINVDDFFDHLEINPNIAEKKMETLNKSSIKEIIDHFKKKNMSVTAPFTMSEGRDSKKAGVGGREQKERWKKDTAWGLGYASAYLTTILHGIQKRRFNVMSAATGVGKTRISISNLAYSCSPYYYDKELGEWCENPNGKYNRDVYIGTEMELLEEIDPILWAYIADVPQEHIQYNMYEEGEEARVDEAIRILEEEANIYLEYVPEYNSEILDTIIEEHKMKQKQRTDNQIQDKK